MTATMLTGLDQLQTLLNDVREAPWIALDTEFQSERVHRPVLCLVQLLVPDRRVWLIDALVPGLMPALAQALSSKPWLVHAGFWDIRLVAEAIGVAPSAGVWDTQIAAGLVGPRHPAGLAWLARTWLGKEIDKSETLSDWSRRPLLPAQLAYAAADVTILPPLREAMAKVLTERGRTSIALEAMNEGVAAALTPEDPADAWRSLHGIDHLEAPELGRVASLARWRLERAMATDQPTRSILGDGTLVAIARKGIDAGGRSIRHLDREAIAGIRASLASPLDVPMGFPHGSPQRRRLAAWGAAAEVLANELGASATLILPDALRRSLALDPPNGPDAVAARLGWRADLLGDPVVAILSGKIGVRLAPDTALSPFQVG